MDKRIVEFLRKKDFILERELGKGACGQTVLLFDNTIDERFACKKYSPAISSMRQELYNSFVREIKLLHLINHRNIVRVFNYYLFPEKLAGYILMEYIQGASIDKYLADNPDDVNEVFNQTIEGFAHLEERRVLHRDIRVANILTTESGTVKIIDLGFGKRTSAVEDFDKSVSLNWWCEKPLEFDEAIYDFSTEVYFVGKLFERLIADLSIHGFKHGAVLQKMCARDPESRISSFADVRKTILSSDLQVVAFNRAELDVYRNFSTEFTASIWKLEKGIRYRSTPEEVLHCLEECFKKVMLEQFIQDPAIIIACFAESGFRYYRSQGGAKMLVVRLKQFIDLLRSVSYEKRNIILANLQTRLDGLERFEKNGHGDDDIPF